jgi:hypothetical protein
MSPPNPSPTLPLKGRGKITLCVFVTYRINFGIARIKLQIITNTDKIKLIIT